MPRLAYCDCNLWSVISTMVVVLSSTEAMSSSPKSSSLTNNNDSMAFSSSREWSELCSVNLRHFLSV